MPRVVSVCPPEGGQNTFDRQARLTNGTQFKRAFEAGQRNADSNFVVLAVVSDGQQARLGMAIGKKVANRAVQRNRLKRLVRETFRRQRKGLQRFDYVVLARHAAPGRSNDDLRRSLDRHWRRYLAAEAA